MWHMDDAMPGQIDWKSLLFGGMVAMVVTYVGLVLPARSQIAALEGQVARLASSVAAFDAARTGVDRATTLLGRLEAQSARLTAVEETIGRVETLSDRFVAVGDRLEAARTALGRIDDLHHAVAARAETAAHADASFAKVDALTQRAAERADRLLALEELLVRTGVDARAADATLVRLSDLAETLAGASGTVGQLQRFVVEVMLLEPAVGRAMRALEPVVEFTQGGRREGAVNVKARAATLDDTLGATPDDDSRVTDVARISVDESR